jgi:hypothetical protein
MAYYATTENGAKMLTKDRTYLIMESNEEREKKRQELVKQQVEAEEEAKRLRKEEEKQKDEALYAVNQVKIEKYLIECLLNGREPDCHIGFNQEHWRKYFYSLAKRLCERISLNSWNSDTRGFDCHRKSYNLDTTSLGKWLEDRCKEDFGITVKVDTFDHELYCEITRLGFFQITNGTNVTKWVISDHDLAAGICDYNEFKIRDDKWHGEDWEEQWNKEWEQLEKNEQKYCF